MNFTKLGIVLYSKTKRFQKFIWGIIISIFFTSCGGGGVPEYLKKARIEVSTRTPIKEVVLENDDLNLVKAIAPLKDSTEFLIIGNSAVCRLSNYMLNLDCKAINPHLSNLDIIRNTSDEPSYIVGNGLWGKPSVAVFDINGQLKWKKDYGYDAMGKTAVLDDGEERFVVLEKEESGLLYLNFETGDIVRKGSTSTILGSADFTGDGHREILVGHGGGDFAILDGKEHALSRLTVSDAYWYKPVVTTASSPFVVLSAGETLAVYNSSLEFIKKFNAKGAPSPMHVVAATFIGNGPDAPFVAVYQGRGGWHRSILYVFSSTGELVYKEILEGNYQSITSVPQGDGMAFLLGGRNEILLYSFQQ